MSMTWFIVYKDKLLTEFPENLSIPKECEPQYIGMPGWMEEPVFQNIIYSQPMPGLGRIKGDYRVKESLIAVGQKRSQTIVKHQVFD